MVLTNSNTYPSLQNNKNLLGLREIFCVELSEDSLVDRLAFEKFYYIMKKISQYVIYNYENENVDSNGDPIGGSYIPRGFNQYDTIERLYYTDVSFGKKTDVIVLNVKYKPTGNTYICTIYNPRKSVYEYSAANNKCVFDMKFDIQPII